MAEILVKARGNDTVQTPGEWLRGHVVAVFDDGHEWGAGERLPDFAILRLPGVPVAKAQQFLAQALAPHPSGIGYEVIAPSAWQLQWTGIPAAAKTKIQANGGLTIGVPAYYNGASDYTWSQLRGALKNLLDNSTAPDIT